MSMIVRIFGQRLFREHDSSDSFMNMIVRVIGLRLFHKHDNLNIWSEVIS